MISEGLLFTTLVPLLLPLLLGVGGVLVSRKVVICLKGLNGFVRIVLFRLVSYIVGRYSQIENGAENAAQS